MHELSVATSLLNIVEQEMAKHNTTRLISVSVKYGKLSNIVPEALSFAFEALNRETERQDAKLELEEIPVKLACRVCKHEFLPETETILLAPCPECGEDIGHTVIQGKEIYIDSIEAE